MQCNVRCLIQGGHEFVSIYIDSPYEASIPRASHRGSADCCGQYVWVLIIDDGASV